MRRTTHNFGFTLMELVLVLVVIAICAAISAPNLRGSVKGRVLPNAAQSLVTTARWCRVQAISDSTEYRLNFDIPTGRWWVTKDDGTGTNFVNVTADAGREFVLPQELSIQNMTFQSQMQASDQGAYISFRPGGTCDTATIVLGSDERTLSITCEGPSLSYHIVKEGQQ
jgi:prepilin-type N-terminal cleavage/methylation domain-containing protein